MDPAGDRIGKRAPSKAAVDYRTFGILLVNEETQELEMKTAVRYGDQSVPTRVKIGTGLVGLNAYALLRVLVPGFAPTG